MSIKNSRVFRAMAFAGAALAASCGSAFAAAPVDPLNSGDTAWMLTSQRVGPDDDHTGAGALLWRHGAQEKRSGDTRTKFWRNLCDHGVVDDHRLLDRIYGQSSSSANAFIGGFSYFFLAPMGLKSVSALAGTIPESVYMFFKMTFAIITPHSSQARSPTE